MSDWIFQHPLFILAALGLVFLGMVILILLSGWVDKDE